MEHLVKAAEYYRDELLDVRFRLIIGKKCKLYHVTISFVKEDFWHIVGNSIIDDIPQFKMNKSKLFDNIICRDEEMSRILSVHPKFNNQQYIDRRRDFLHLKDALVSENAVFIIIDGIRDSSIKSDFVLQCSLSDKQKYWIFLRDRSPRLNINVQKEASCYAVISAFTNNDKDYSKSQSKCTVLYKSIYSSKDNSEVVIEKSRSLKDEYITSSWICWE